MYNPNVQNQVIANPNPNLANRGDDHLEQVPLSTTRQTSCYLATWSIIVLAGSVAFGAYSMNAKLCGSTSFERWQMWCFCTVALAAFFFLYIWCFKCQRAFWCCCWKCCGNDANSACATKCKICYEGCCGNPIYYGLGYITWGIIEFITTVSSNCTNSGETLVLFGFVADLILISITILIFCYYHYYRTRRHWKKRRNRRIAEEFNEQQLQIKQQQNNNNQNNIPINQYQQQQLQLQPINPNSIPNGGGIPISIPNGQIPVINGSQNQAEIEVEYDVIGEGGEGGKSAGVPLGKSIPNPQYQANVPNVPNMNMGYVPSQSIQSPLSAHVSGYAQYPNNYGNMNMPIQNPLDRQRSKSAGARDANNINNNNNNAHRRDSSVSISISIPNGQINLNNNISGNRPAALSDPMGGSSSNIIQKPVQMVRQVSFPNNFAGVARRASTNTIDKMTKNEEECCICLGDFELGDDIATLQCFHHFHKKCIIGWLRDEKPECPVCNTTATIQ